MAVSRWISEVMHSYKKKGKIGKSRPKSKEAAHKQAIAIAFDKVQRGKKP